MNWIAVLTASAGILDRQTAEVLAQLDDAQAPRRLAQSAVEIAFSADEQPELAPGSDYDLNIVPAQDRRKKILIADMDSTMIPVECIDELADFVGKKDEVAAVTERAMRGELDFGDALRTRVLTLKGVTRAEIDECRETRVSLNPGARVLVQTMNALGAYTALVSGGFTVFTGPVARDAGFQMNRANELLFDGDALDGTVAHPICGADTKLETLNALLEEQGVLPSQVIAVGDGANDAPMIDRAGLGVAYHAKPMLRERAKARLDHSDLTALLSLQGISEDEYVSD